MENIFVVGANNQLSDSFSNIAGQFENNVFFVNDSGAGDVTWNKASPISARGVFLKAQNLYEEINKAFVIFNSDSFQQYRNFDVENITRSVDSMILGYSYMTSEICNYFEAQGKGETIFVLLSSCPENEKSIIQNMGEAAFTALGESIAAQKSDAHHLHTLIKSDVATFETNLEWLFPYLKNPSARKAAANPKYAKKWIKVGARPPVLLPLPF